MGELRRALPHPLLLLSLLLLSSIVAGQLKPTDPSAYYSSVLTSDGFWRVNGNWNRPGFPVTRNTSAILPPTPSDATVILENGTSNVVFQTVIGSKRRVRVGPNSRLTIIPYLANGGSSCLATVETCSSWIGNPLTVIVTDTLNPYNETTVSVTNSRTGQSFTLLLTSEGNGTFSGSVATNSSSSPTGCDSGNFTVLCLDFGDLVNITYAAFCIPQQIISVSLYLECGRYENISSSEIIGILLQKSLQDNINLLEDIQSKAEFVLANLPESFDSIFELFDFTQLAELILQASTTCLNDYCLEVEDFLASLQQLAPQLVSK